MTRPAPNRSDPEAHKAKVRAANRARYKAIQQLIAAHRWEYNDLYARQAAIEGVEPKPRDPISVHELEHQLAVVEKRLAKARQRQQDGDGGG